MRGQDEQQLGVFSYISPEQRVPQDHPLRQLRVMADEALRELKPRFGRRTVSPHFPSAQLIPGTSRTYVWQLRYSTWKLLFRQWEGYSRFEKLAVISASPSYEQIP